MITEPKTAYRSCVDFLDVSCCSSCHEDEEEGYFELAQLRKGNEIANVCCHVSEKLQEQGWEF